MSRIFITGGKGFVGGLLSQSLKAKNLFNERVDVTDRSALQAAIRDFRPEVIFHLASPTDVAACETDINLAERSILGGTENILQSLVAPTRLVYASSMMVYEEPQSGKNILAEDATINPKTNYARAKLAAEDKVKTWAEKTNSRYHILRIFPHTHHTQKGSRFLSRVHEQFKNKGSADLPQNLHSMGRDIGAGRDLARALHLLAENEIESGTYNICTGRARNLARLASLMGEKLSKEVNFGGAEAAENFYCGSYEKFNLASSWAPHFLTDEDLINYYLSEQA